MVIAITTGLQYHVGSRVEGPAVAGLEPAEALPAGERADEEAITRWVREEWSEIKPRSPEAGLDRLQGRERSLTDACGLAHVGTPGPDSGLRLWSTWLY